MLGICVGFNAYSNLCFVLLRKSFFVLASLGANSLSAGCGYGTGLGRRQRCLHQLYTIQETPSRVCSQYALPSQSCQWLEPRRSNDPRDAYEGAMDRGYERPREHVRRNLEVMAWQVDNCEFGFWHYSERAQESPPRGGQYSPGTCCDDSPCGSLRTCDVLLFLAGAPPIRLLEILASMN